MAGFTLPRYSRLTNRRATLFIQTVVNGFQSAGLICLEIDSATLRVSAALTDSWVVFFQVLGLIASGSQGLGMPS